MVALLQAKEGRHGGLPLPKNRIFICCGYTEEASKGKITLALDDGSNLELDLLSDDGELVLANIVSGVRYVLAESQRRYLFPLK